MPYNTNNRCLQTCKNKVNSELCFILLCQSPIISQVSLRTEVHRPNEVQRLQQVQISDYIFIYSITFLNHFNKNPKPRCNMEYGIKNIHSLVRNLF